MRKMFLIVAEKVHTRLRITESHLPALRPQLQAQRPATQPQPPVHRLQQRLTLVLPIHQAVPLQRRLQVLSHRVVQPVLPNPQPRIHPSLPPHVLPPRPRRRHLQHEVRPLPFLPHLVAHPHPVLHPEHHEHVRRHRHPRVPLLVVDEQVTGHVHVIAPGVARPQHRDAVHDGGELGVVLGQGLAVRTRVLDLNRGAGAGGGSGGGEGGQGGLAHGRSPLDGAAACPGRGPRGGVPACAERGPRGGVAAPAEHGPAFSERGWWTTVPRSWGRPKPEYRCTGWGRTHVRGMGDRRVGCRTSARCAVGGTPLRVDGGTGRQAGPGCATAMIGLHRNR